MEMGFWLISMGLLVVSVIAVELWSFARKLFKWRRELPPGPFPLPVIGNLHNVGKIPHKSLAELAKVHGPLMSLQLGRLTTVVVSSPAMAQQILQKHDQVLSNRWVPDAVRVFDHHHFSVVFLPPNLAWRTIRKTCNSHAYSNRCVDASQDLRQRKVDDLISYVRGCCEGGTVVDIGKEVFSLNMNIVSNTFFSMDLAELNSTFNLDFKQIIWNLTYEAGTPNLGDYFPVMRSLDLQGIRHRMEGMYDQVLSLFQRIINQRLANKGADTRDLLNAFLQLHQEDGEKFEMSYIKNSILDFFIGGTETVSSTIEWAMTELLRDQSKLEKARQELKLVVGKGNSVKEGDIARLPYLQAVVKETLRLHPPAPFLVPREASEDVDLCGFKIPKGSKILINVWAIGRDPSVWDRPVCFEPERFLGSSIDYKGQHFEFTPFGGGRRLCPGLTHAIRILHLTLGSLIHSFGWKLEDGVEPKCMDMEEKFGMAVQKARPLLAIPLTV